MPSKADPVDAGQRHPWLRLTLVGSAVVLFIALAVLLVFWTRQDTGQRVEAGILKDTHPAQAGATSTSQQLPEPKSDSASHDDSAAMSGAAPIPAPTVDSALAREPTRDSAPSAATTPPTPRVDAARTREPTRGAAPSAVTTPPVRAGANRRASGGVAPESLSVACLRLLERVSVGEKLTEAEAALLRRRCQR